MFQNPTWPLKPVVAYGPAIGQPNQRKGSMPATGRASSYKNLRHLSSLSVTACRFGSGDTPPYMEFGARHHIYNIRLDTVEFL